MARNIFELFGTITVNGLDGVKVNLKKLDDQFKQTDATLGKLGRQTVALGTAITKNVTLPLAALGAGLGVIITKTSDYARELEKLEAITGLSANSLQEFQHISKMTDTNFEGLTNSIQRFSRQLPQIAKEGGPAYNAIKALGINIYDAHGHIRDINDLFPEFIKRLQNIQNPTERNSLAQQIFGRSLTDLAPILSLTNKQFDDMIKEAHSMGLVMSGPALKSAEDMGKEIIKLKETFGAFTRDIGMVLIPIIRDNVIPIIERFANGIKGVITWFKNLDDTSKANLLMLAGLIATIGPAILIMGKMVFVIKSLATAFALARAASIGMTLALAVNPFAIAAVGALALIAALVALKSASDNYTKEKAKKASDDAITKELQDFIKLRQEQETIIAMGEKSHFTMFSKQAVADAKENLKQIQAAIKTFNKENGLAAPDEPIAAPQPKLPGAKDNSVKKFEEAFDERNRMRFDEKRLQDEMRQHELDGIDKEVNAEQKAAKEKEQLDEEEKKRRDEAVQQSYERLLKSQKSEIQLLNEQRKDELSKVAGNKQAEAAINEYYDKMIFNKKKALAIQGLQFIGDAIGKLGQLFQMNSDNQITQIENEQKAQTDAINGSTLSEANKKIKIDALNADTAKKETAIKRQAAKEQKAIALMGAIVNTAVAVVSALQTQPVWFGIVMAAIVGALGVAQIALIAAQPIPLAEGALVKGKRGGIQAQIGEGNQDEIVMPIHSGAKMLAEALFDKIGATWARPQPAMAFAGTGGGLSSRSGDLVLNIGTFIGDDRGIKELERRLLPFRISEAQRKGQMQ